MALVGVSSHQPPVCRHLHGLPDLPAQGQDSDQTAAEGERRAGRTGASGQKTPPTGSRTCVCVRTGNPEEEAVRGAECHPAAPPAGADAELHHPSGEWTTLLPALSASLACVRASE